MTDNKESPWTPRGAILDTIAEHEANGGAERAPLDEGHLILMKIADELAKASRLITKTVDADIARPLEDKREGMGSMACIMVIGMMMQSMDSRIDSHKVGLQKYIMRLANEHEAMEEAKGKEKH